MPSAVVLYKLFFLSVIVKLYNDINKILNDLKLGCPGLLLLIFTTLNNALLDIIGIRCFKRNYHLF